MRVAARDTVARCSRWQKCAAGRIKAQWKPKVARNQESATMPSVRGLPGDDSHAGIEQVIRRPQVSRLRAKLRVTLPRQLPCHLLHLFTCSVFRPAGRKLGATRLVLKRSAACSWLQPQRRMLGYDPDFTRSTQTESWSAMPGAMRLWAAVAATSPTRSHLAARSC